MAVPKWEVYSQQLSPIVPFQLPASAPTQLAVLLYSKISNNALQYKILCVKLLHVMQFYSSFMVFATHSSLHSYSYPPTQTSIALLAGSCWHRTPVAYMCTCPKGSR